MDPADCHQRVSNLRLKEFHLVNHGTLVLFSFLGRDDQCIYYIGAISVDAAQDGASFDLIVRV